MDLNKPFFILILLIAILIVYRLCTSGFKAFSKNIKNKNTVKTFIDAGVWWGSSLVICVVIYKMYITFWK
jgi:hypothetical protein